MVQGHAVADVKSGVDRRRSGNLLSPALSSTSVRRRGRGRRKASAYFDDDAGGFVSEDARGWQGAEVDFLDVGGADATDGDFDEEFAGVDGRDGDGFEAEIVGAAINDGGHGGGEE
jgi:hypothetical protein